MGLGWWYWNKQQYATHNHNGGSEGFNSSLTFIKELETAVVVLYNVGTYAIRDELSNEIFRENSGE